MSSTRISDGFPGGQRRSYIATDNFQNFFFTYTVTHDRLITTGDISVPVTNDCTKTPQGRVLKENGRKLYPVANPGVGKFYVGVYDSVTFLSGYIDPNAPVFAIFNGDRSYQVDDCSDDGDDDCSIPEAVKTGPPVYTAGDITTTAGNIVARNESGGNAIALINRNTQDCDDSVNPIFNSNTYSFGAICGIPESDTIVIKAVHNVNQTGALIGSEGSIVNTGLFYPLNATSTVKLTNGTTGILYHPLMNSSNRVMLTHQSFIGAPGALYCSPSDDGSYYISSSTTSDEGYVHYLILGGGSNIFYL
jgi:hypothetical protein